jgi:CRP/FNR family cyclic AMP-dependent transcriptional regulator
MFNSVASPPLTEEILSPLSPSLRALAVRGVLRGYRKGTLLIEEGTQGDNIYLIVSGLLRAFASDNRGREVTYGVYGAGEYVGEMSLDGGLRSANVITETAAQCILITRTSLLAHIAENPDFALELLTKVIRRARSTTLSTKQLALNDVYGRLKALLETQAVGDEPLRLTHQAMAQRLGCSREMVSKLMKDLELGGYLSRVSNGCYRVLRSLPARW